MVDRGEAVLVAVSGGQDSLALLHVLRDLQEEIGVSLRVAHLDHRIRGEKSAADARFVQELCSQWDVPCQVGVCDVPKQAAEEGTSMEQAARRARYEFLRETAAKHGCHKIALGHTASDRAETVLLNLLRGTGLKGLRGIPAVNGQVIRPLILVRREETATYCTACGLQFRLDETNLDVEGNLRNRVRLQLLPLLRQNYAPHIDESLQRLADAVCGELQWTEELVAEAYATATAQGEGLQLRLQRLQQLPCGLRNRVLMRALEELLGDLTGIGARHIAALEGLVLGGKVGAEVRLPFEVWAKRGYNKLVIGRGVQAASPLQPWEVALPIPGRARLPCGGVLDVRVEPPPVDVKAAGPGEAFLCLRAGEAGLVVRSWREGDRMQPLGMCGHRKLQDLFVDAKVPRDERWLRPVVADGRGQIVWVAGLRIAEQAALQPGDTECLHLLWRPETPGDTCSRGL